MEADESGDGRGRGSAVLTYIISYFQPERNKGEGKERMENQGKRQEDRNTKIFFEKRRKGACILERSVVSYLLRRLKAQNAYIERMR